MKTKEIYNTMNENAKNDAMDVIDINYFISIIRKYIVLLLIGSILGGIASYFYTKYFIPERYRATATVIVNNVGADTQYFYTSEMNTSRSLAQLYTVVIKSDTVLKKVIDDLDLNMSYQQLMNSVQVTAIENTQVVEISVVSTNPDYALKITEKFVECSKIMIAEKFETGSVKDLNVASLVNNGAPISPDKRKNTIKGVLIGFVIITAIVFLREYLDTKIRTEADAVAALNVPLLGVVPIVDRKDFTNE